MLAPLLVPNAAGQIFFAAAALNWSQGGVVVEERKKRA
jgi:hypothetical protein